MDYRVEDKYLITDTQIEYIKANLKELMELDTHAEDGTYMVRSLYYDDRFNSCLMDNENGVSERYKYRVRIYNNDISTIHLEKKSVRKGFVHKDSCKFSISGLNSIDSPTNEDDYLYKCFYADTMLKGFRPVSIVEYERTAFVEKRGNVRITFDQNIGGCGEVGDFTKGIIPVRPLLPRGVHIMEVKYDEILPGYLKQIIDSGSFNKTSYSKYYYSRNAVII